MKTSQSRYSPEELETRMEKCSVQPHVRQWIQTCVEFHTSPAPGILIGAFMVDYAMELLGVTPDQKIYGVCETPKCLPDALQTIAHCTIGNNRLRIIPVGKFAISMNTPSDGTTADAVRVFVDCKKLKKFKTIDTWYANSPSYDKKSMKDLLQEEIFRAGRSILSSERIRIQVKPRSPWKSVTCPCCGDPVPDYLLEDDHCCACGSMKYYEKIHS